MSGTDTIATAPLSMPPRPGELVLTAIAGDRATSYRLPPRGELVIGRSRDCGLRIDDPSISRHHAKLVVGERISVEDLGGTNGTRLRGRTLAKGERAEVALGDTLDVGAVLLVLQRAPKEDTPPPVAVDGGGAMERLRALVERIAVGTLPVLITGETGVGKEVLAGEIHRRSPRAKAPLVTINCAAVAENLLESELFGHEKGAFTGAAQAKPGLIETAHGGTLLLDEVGELSPQLQAKLLRVLEQREVMRVGAVRPRAVDVRFLSATHRDLPAAIARGAFRQDLYFRLNGITLTIPPLRERRGEIPSLAKQFIAHAARQLGRRPPSLTDAALAALAAHSWPGNIRELRNLVERAVLLATGDRVDAADLVFDAPAATASATQPSAPEAGGPDRQRVIDALAQCAGNQTRAAELLGVSRRTLTNWLNALDLPRPRK